MKIINLQEEKQIHLSDIIKEIDSIWIYDFIEDAHYFSDISLCEDDDIDIASEDDLLFYSNDQLKKLNKKQIDRIKNPEILDRLAKIDFTKLTDEQVKILQDIYKNKVIISKEDIEKFLDILKKCDTIFLAGTSKNISFRKKYNLKPDDYLEAIKQLKVSDYYSSTRDFTLGHFGNNLMIFQPKNIKLANKKLDNLTIYIKFDVDETDGITAVMISFHNTNKQNNLPFID